MNVNVNELIDEYKSLCVLVLKNEIEGKFDLSEMYDEERVILRDRLEEEFNLDVDEIENSI